MKLTLFQPIIPEEIVENYKARIKLLLEDARVGPELRVQDFDKYMPLFNGEVIYFYLFKAEIHDSICLDN